jgi:hypothetical protein
MVPAMAIVPTYTALKMSVGKASSKDFLMVAPQYIWEVVEI